MRPSRSEPLPEHVSWVTLAVASSGLAGWADIGGRHLPWLSGHLAFVDRHTLWITPASYLLFLLPAGLAAMLVSRAVPARHKWLVRYFLQLFPALFGVAWMLHPRVHRYAVLLLSLGVAVQLARLAAGRPAATRSVVRYVTIGAIALSLTGAIVAGVLPKIAERQALQSLPASASNAPNVLLLVLDTVRAPSLSAYGYDRPTSPELEVFARRAVKYERAFATTSWTLPSHASMFTGRYPYELSADWEVPLDARDPVLAEVFRGAGYRTGGFVGNIEYVSAEAGMARGFAHFEDWPVSFWRIASEGTLAFFVLDNPLTRRTLNFHETFVQRPAADVIDGFLEWKQRTNRLGRPYFAFINLYDAHAPCIPPAPFRGRFGATEARQRAMSFGRLNGGALRPGDTLTAAELDEEQRAYDSGIAYLDAELGRLFRTLAAAGELDSTIVAITSDHGEHFGEFGLRSHGTALYAPGLHVPLLIAYPPTVPAGTTVDRAVTLRDLPATLLDLAGIRGHALPGTSLVGAWQSARAADDGSMILSELWAPRNVEAGVPVAHGYMRSLIQWPGQLIVRGDHAVELLDLRGPGAAADIDPARRQSLEEQLRRLPVTPFPDRNLRVEGNGGTQPVR